MAFLNKNGVERLWLHIISKLNGKVDKVEGKGLSTNDYTTEEKECLVALGTLVGDTAVSTQINNAVSNITPNSLGALDEEDYYGLVEKEGVLVSAKSLDGTGIKVTSYIEATQDGSGDPSPDNIRPIAGWDTAIITRTGSNLVSHLDYTITQGNRATIVTDELIDVAVASGMDYATIPVHLKAGVTYTLCIEHEVYGRDESNTLPTQSQYGLVAAPSALTVNAKANGLYKYVQTYTSTADIDTKIRVYVNYGNSLTGSNGNLSACGRVRVMLVEGAYTVGTMPPFEPGMRQTLTAELPETIYGGMFDWTNGLLTVTHGHIASYSGENVPDGWISSVGALTDGAQVVYPLAEPYTIQLDPQQIKALQGVNTVWSNCGNTRALFNYSLHMDTTGFVKSVNGVSPDETGNVTVDVGNNGHTHTKADIVDFEDITIYVTDDGNGNVVLEGVSSATTYEARLNAIQSDVEALSSVINNNDILVADI